MNEDDKKNNGIIDETKDQAKKKIKKKVLHVVLPYLIGALGIILCVAMVFIIFYSVVENVKDFFNGVGNSISTWWDNITGDISDEKLDALIAQIESTGVSFDDLRLMRRN